MWNGGGTPFAVYERLLSKLKLGHALWQPEPSKNGEIQIGDVGFIHEGGFVRLFNVFEEKDSQLNKESVPDDFRCFQQPREKLRNTRLVAIKEGRLQSTSMQTVELNLTGQTYVSNILLCRYTA